MIHGHLDPTLDHRLHGWAWNSHQPYSRISLEIRIDGQHYRHITADLYRPDLPPAGIGDGHHGFTLPLPLTVFDGLPHTITTVPALTGSPLIFEAFIDGAVESVKDGIAQGWLQDRVHPNARSLPVNLSADGQVIARGTTHPDSNRFHIHIPNGFDTSQIRKWTLRENLPWRDKSAIVDIVVPVYAGIAETLKALERAARKQPDTGFELIVINDNPDDPAMAEALAQQQARLGYTLLTNDRNLGFVRTVNRGMALHSDRDVVLLNSDTEVPESDWLDRLRRAIYDQAHAGTATPFSNNATICSYPHFCESNPPVDYDSYCREHLRGQTADIPTAVGFCMYIRRDCLNDTGLFDAHTFGRGYGEENDFCMRARRFGWQHVLAADVFVVHHGHVSFQSASGHSAENAAKLSALHPKYDALIADFIQRDPLQTLRRTLDIARLTPNTARVCIATNTLPGGNERFVQELRQRYPDPVVMRYRQGRYISLDAGTHFEFDIDRERDLLAHTLRQLGVTRLHINQIVDAPLGIFELGIPYEVTIHDYAWICPQVTLQDETGEYCGEPHVWHCESCYRKLGPHKDWGSLLQRASSVEEMRGDNLEALRRAEYVNFPSQDIATRMGRYFEPRAARVVPHEFVKVAARRQIVNQNGRVRVVYIGSLGYAKGFHVLYALALDAMKRQLPLDFTIIGSAVESRPLEELGVKILGYYQSDAEALESIEAVDPHVALFPGVLPESFSYTLSLAFAAGLYPVAFDIGAIAERIRETGFGSTIPVGSTPAEINDLLLKSANT